MLGLSRREVFQTILVAILTSAVGSVIWIALVLVFIPMFTISFLPAIQTMGFLPTSDTIENCQEEVETSATLPPIEGSF